MPSSTGGPTPFISGGGKVATIATHFTYEHDAMGPLTLRDLASWYGVSTTTMRKALRLSDPVFHSQGLTLRVPEFDEGWVVATTDDQDTFNKSTIYRVQAMMVETARYEAGEAAIAVPGATRLFDGVTQFLADLADSLIEATA